MLQVSFHLASLNTGSPSWLVPRLQPRHLAYLGLRDVETAEREVIRDLGIAAYYTQVTRMAGQDLTRPDKTQRVGRDVDKYLVLAPLGIDSQDLTRARRDDAVQHVMLHLLGRGNILPCLPEGKERCIEV